jgi:Domain of unknown function (DUF4062)
MRRPTFFLSSTIYDFKDLRSSLKFYLEQQGFTVLASEFNDFPKPLDTHSYEACIQTLEKADYFILLIGSRVGGWFNKQERISITQQEYREAYKLHLANRIKIITFVRYDVWQFREQRTELTRHLEQSGIDPGAVQAVRSAPSKFSNDAEFITHFISEVCRNIETKNAVNDNGKLPTGNWVHTFDTFRDIVDSIQTQTFSGTPVDFSAFKRILARELTEILRTCLVKFDNDKVFSPLNSIKRFHNEHHLTLDSRQNPETEVTVARWSTISTFAVSLMAIRIHTAALDRALESSYFLNYSRETNTFVEDPIYEALYLLRNQIHSLSLTNTNDIITFIVENSPTSRPGSPTKIRVNTFKLLLLLGTMDRWSNIIQLSTSILKHLNGHEFKMPELRQDSPIKDMNAQLEAERVTDEDIFRFIDNSSES